MIISSRLFKNFRQIVKSHVLMMSSLILSVWVITATAGQTSNYLKYHFASDRDFTQMQFDLYNNLIFVEAQINDSKALWFMLDSGIEGSAVNISTARELGLALSGEHKEDAPGGSIDMANIVGIAIKLPGLEVSNLTVMAIPLDPLEPVLGRKIEGILGHDFFENFVIDINYTDGTLTFYDPSNYQYKGNGISIPVSIENNQPFISGEIVAQDSSSVQAKLKLDTGSTDLLGLNGSFVKSEKLIGPEQKTIPAPGVALGGSTKNYLTRIPSLRIGEIEIDNPVIGYSEDTTRTGDAGTIGEDFFHRFNVVFDYSRKHIILEKNNYFSEPLEYDMSGLFLTAEGPDFKTIKVTNVADDSPGDQGGIQNGDIITKINDRNAGGYSLADIREMFKSEGQEYKLTVDRGGTLIETSIKLRKLI